MTYGINCFDTSILSRIEVTEGDDPIQKVNQLAIVGGGGTDFVASPRTSRKCN
jgi:hypothetical protein